MRCAFISRTANTMGDVVDAVTVWKVKDGALCVYSDGVLVASIPSREFPNLGVAICTELSRQSIKTAAR